MERRKFSTKNRPFYFRSGHVANTVEELLQVSEEQQKDAIHHLVRGDFEHWLQSRGRSDLARIAQGSRLTTSTNEDRLALFIGFARLVNHTLEARDKRFSFLLVGRTGVGKSSAINTLLGKEIAKVGDGEPVTAHIETYEAEIQGVPCLVIDTPGLSDGKVIDSDYTDQMRKLINEQGIHCLWFVSTLPEERVRIDELGAINSITQDLGKDIWKHAVIVLAFADRLDVNEYPAKVATRTKYLREAIAEARSAKGKVGAEIADNIPVVPISNRREFTPDRQRWLGRLYIATLKHIAADGFASFLSATVERVVIAEPASTSVSPVHEAPRSSYYYPAYSAPRTSPTDSDPMSRDRTAHDPVPPRVEDSRIYVESKAVSEVVPQRYSEIFGETVSKAIQIGEKLAGERGRMGGLLVGVAAGTVRVAGEMVNRGIEKLYSWIKSW